MFPVDDIIMRDRKQSMTTLIEFDQIMPRRLAALPANQKPC